MKMQIKRVYEEPDKEDGFRVLVDRLWPRGLSKEKAGVDLWLKEIAPTTELRKWFNHDPKKWIEFKRRYIREIKDNSQPLLFLREQIKEGNLTLLYAAKDEIHNEAIVILNEL
jgi:uncharacterized protein YeaO (DUF488 family)